MASAATATTSTTTATHHRRRHEEDDGGDLEGVGGIGEEEEEEEEDGVVAASSSSVTTTSLSDIPLVEIHDAGDDDPIGDDDDDAVKEGEDEDEDEDEESEEDEDEDDDEEGSSRASEGEDPRPPQPAGQQIGIKINLEPAAARGPHLTLPLHQHLNQQQQNRNQQTDSSVGKRTVPIQLPSLGTKFVRLSGGLGQETEDGDGTGGDVAKTTSIGVDLLSHAFRLRQETVAQAVENGHGLGKLIAGGFAAALEIPEASLRYYRVEEVEPAEIGDDWRHVAVGIDASTFTLARLEDMLEESKKNQQQLLEKRKTIDEQKKQIQGLQEKIQEYQETLKRMGTEKTTLLEEVEGSRQQVEGQRQPSTSSQSGLLIPKQMLADRGLHRFKTPLAMQKLRETLQQQSTLVSEIESHVSNHAGARWAALDVMDNRNGQTNEP